MSGKFDNAPLVYTSAAIRTSTLPSLTTDQTAEIEQRMVSTGLIHHKTSSPSILRVTLGATSGDPIGAPVSDVQKGPPRLGYFSDDRQEAIIISPTGFEWRTCKYKKYSGLRESFKNHISTLTDIVSSYGEVKVEETLLSYSDVIAPIKGRSLKDYFSKGDGILPITILGDEPSTQQYGATEAIKFIDHRTKITVIIEQHPTKNGRISKYVPDRLAESDPEFGQRLTVKEDWQSELDDRKTFALLLTQAAARHDCPLKNYLAEDLFKDAHKLTSELFFSLINREVCDKDWKFNTKGAKQ